MYSQANIIYKHVVFLTAQHPVLIKMQVEVVFQLRVIILILGFVLMSRDRRERRWLNVSR